MPAGDVADAAAAVQSGVPKALIDMSWEEVVTEVEASYTRDTEGHKGVVAFLKNAVENPKKVMGLSIADFEMEFSYKSVKLAHRGVLKRCLLAALAVANAGCKEIQVERMVRARSDGGSSAGAGAVTATQQAMADLQGIANNDPATMAQGFSVGL